MVANDKLSNTALEICTAEQASPTQDQMRQAELPSATVEKGAQRTPELVEGLLDDSLRQERNAALRMVIDDLITSNPSLAKLVTHHPICTIAARNWSRTRGLKDLGARSVKGSSEKIASSSGGAIHMVHKFLVFPDDTIFDSTYRQFLSYPENENLPEGVPRYFIGTLDQLKELFREQRDHLAPHVRDNILKIENVQRITPEQTDQLVNEVWGRVRKTGNR